MSRKAQAWKLNRRTTLTLAELARAVNPVLGGWLAYFTRFYPTAVIPLCKRINRHLIRWTKTEIQAPEAQQQTGMGMAGRRRRTSARLFTHWKYCATT
jgi:RNA-directed DNA polymerase